MRFYVEPVNLRQWNLFDKVKGPGHVECFLATRDMQLGDIIILHVGKQDPAHESGVYAYENSHLWSVYSRKSSH